MDFDLRNEFIQHEEDKKCQSNGDEILDEEVVDQSKKIGIDVLFDNAALPDGPVNARPHEGDEDRNQHDYPYGEHDEVLHEAV